MDENTPKRPVNPRRRKRTPMQNFKEAYLPVILVALVALLILIFIISSVRNALQKKEDERKESIDASESQAAMEQAQKRDADALLIECQKMYSHMDYDGVLAKISAFDATYSNASYNYAELVQLKDQCTEKKKTLVEWSNLADVPNLSFHMLIADPQRAFSHKGFSPVLKADYVTVSEFSAIIQQLYDNGYVLIRPQDMVTSEADGMKPCSIYLPEGKKPIMITETHTNYYTYLIDSDGDGLADANGAGFASRLLVDESGNFTCEMVDASGKTVTGAYDVVPILEAFIKEHPDFSYHGSKAVLAMTGYDGVLGYRTNPNPEVPVTSDPSFYQQQAEEAKKVAQALKDAGYTLACYTWDHAAYGYLSEIGIQEDLTKWKEQVVPVIGQVDTMVFAKSSDISDGRNYVGRKYDVLKDNGFKYYLGFCSSGSPWATVSDEYARVGRILVYGDVLKEPNGMFNGMFDPSTVLDSSR